MSSTEEQQVALIPRNFMERGTFMGGMFKIRNAIEGAVLAAGIGIPVVHLPLSLTTRIIILCMTSLPAAMVALIGIGGESLTAFLMNALRFVKNRRIIYRSDVMPDYRKRRQHARNREPKSQKRKKNRGNTKQGAAVKTNCSNYTSEETADQDSQSDALDARHLSRKARKKEAARQKIEQKRERRIFDTSTSGGIKKQAKEDIRILKVERKLAKKAQAQALKDAKREKAERERQRKEDRKDAVRTAKYEKKEARRREKYEQKEAARLEKETKREAAYRKKHPDSPPSSPAKKKKRKYQTLEDYLPIEKIANGIVYTTDHRYVKILEIEPINFLLRSAREQQSIIYSFISYLKISPVKLQIKMISKKADINRHLEQSARELERESDPRCRELQRDYIQFVRHLSSREAVSRRFFLIFEYEPFNVNRKTEEKEILAALETAAQTAKTFLYQCGNDIVSHENEDEFTTDVLYTLLNRTLCTDKPLPERITEVLGQRMAEGKDVDAIHYNTFTAPESLDLKHSNYVRINGLYHTYLMVPSDGYKNKVTPGWLSLLINAGEGIDIDFYLHKQPKDKIQQRLGQQIRINRSKIKDASDTNSDFDDLDSAIVPAIS